MDLTRGILAVVWSLDRHPVAVHGFRDSWAFVLVSHYIPSMTGAVEE
jgi:hypothetical protein